ncbi:MAG: TPM domain-containing protein [Sphingomonadaceae bacterium]
MRRIAAFLALLLALVSTTARAEYPARPDGPIADYAHVLKPADAASLDSELRAYNAKTGRAIIVATVPSLDGQAIEDYGLALAEKWGIGGKESQNGVLLLVAPSERKLTIRTARGVDTRLTDIMSGRIIRDVIVPQFKQGDMSQGIVDGVNAIIQQLDMDPAQAKAIEEAEAARKASQKSSEGGFPIGALFWFAFLFFFFILPMFGRGRRRRRYRSPWGNAARDIMLWEVGKGIARSFTDHDDWGGGGGFGGGGGGGGFGGFGGGGGGFTGGGASGGW